MEIRDYDRVLRGYVHRSETLQPKALTDCPNYCRLHFPYLSTPCTALVLVEDIISAEVLAPYIPTAALCGASLSADQATYLHTKGIRLVTFCLDEDATSKAVLEALKYRTDFTATAVPCVVDPKDMSHEQLVSLTEAVHAVRNM